MLHPWSRPVNGVSPPRTVSQVQLAPPKIERMNTVETLDHPQELEPVHRTRLLQAMAAVSAGKGLALTTIADIVREAGVSKRTFYEHFASKEACFLALYRAASASAMRTLREALKPDRPWQTQIEHALLAYFEHLAAGPGLVRVLFIDIHHLGPEGLRARRDVMQQLANFMVATVNGAALPSVAPLRALSPAMAMAAVGGINELVLQAIEHGQAAELKKLTPCAGEIVRALTHADLAGL